MGCRNKLTIAGLAFLLTMLESVQVRSPRIATGGSGTQTLLVEAQVDALDVSGNSLLDDSIPYFVEVRGGLACAGRPTCVRACAQVCLRARTHVRTFDPARPAAREVRPTRCFDSLYRLLWQALSKPSVKTKELVLAGNNLAGNGALPVRRRRTGGRFRGTREPRPPERDRGGARRGAWPYINSAWVKIDVSDLIYNYVYIDIRRRSLSMISMSL